MSVQNKPLNEPAPDRSQRSRIDWTLLLGKLGVVLAIVSFGGIFWAINGGFSVLGLEVLATSFNQAGTLFWSAMSALTFRVPITVPRVPADQPLIPWLGVIAASLLQIVVLYRKLKGLAIPHWMWVAALVLSGYDLVTTFFGLGTVTWIVGAGKLVQGGVAVILTFIVEGAVSVILRRL